MSAYDLPPELEVEIDGPIRVVRLNRPDQLNATNHVLHRGLAELFPQIDADPTPEPSCSPATGGPSRPVATSTTSTS